MYHKPIGSYHECHEVYGKDDKGAVTYSGAGGTYSSYGNYRAWCSHWRTSVKPFADRGLKLSASGWSDRPAGYEWGAIRPSVADPNVGVYFDTAWAKLYEGMILSSGVAELPFAPRLSTDVILYPWVDYSIPQDLENFAKAARWIMAQLQAGSRVDLGCWGGHGRTGTALACLLVLLGEKPGRACQIIRNEYCIEAIETTGQVNFVRDFWILLNGELTALDPDATVLDRQRALSWKGTSSTLTEPKLGPTTTHLSGDNVVSIIRKGAEGEPTDEFLRRVAEDHLHLVGDPNAFADDFSDQEEGHALCMTCNHKWSKHDSISWEDERYRWCEEPGCECQDYDDPDQDEVRQSYEKWWEHPEGAYCPNGACDYPNLCNQEERECFLLAVRQGKRRAAGRCGWED